MQEDDYFIVVNAANKDKDFAWIKAQVQGDVEVQDISETIAQLALQGPKAETILKKLTTEDQIPTGYYTANFQGTVAGFPAIISRTGYTGEDGFELYVSPEHAPALWDLLLEQGAEEGLIPCGLGARDTLRLEAAMPLYGHEMNDEITPRTAGLGSFVKMKKEEFIGKEALERLGKPTERRVGLKVTGKGIAREHQDVYADGRKIGVTTSGTHSPYLKYPIAMAIVEDAYRTVGTQVEVDVRGRRVAAEVVKLPFYKKD